MLDQQSNRTSTYQSLLWNDASAIGGGYTTVEITAAWTQCWMVIQSCGQPGEAADAAWRLIVSSICFVYSTMTAQKSLFSKPENLRQIH